METKNEIEKAEAFTNKKKLFYASISCFAALAIIALILLLIEKCPEWAIIELIIVIMLSFALLVAYISYSKFA